MFRLYRGLILLAAAALAFSGAAFAEAGESFAYTVLEDGSAMITGCSGSGEALAFPETVDGHTVTALSGNFGVNTAAVRDLKSITIPNTMTTIEPGALQFAGSLTEIRVAGDHPVMRFEDGVLYNKERGSLMLYLQTNTAEQFDVPEGIREAEDKAFFRAGLSSVRIPGSVERIGCECFNQCFALAEVVLSEGLKTIGREAFSNCDRLKRILLPASVSDIEEAAFLDNRLEEIRTDPGNSVFAVSDGALINIRDGVLIAYPTGSAAEACRIPEGVTRIGSFAFYRAHHLTQITFPDGLLEIGRSAFLSCNHLPAIDLPDSVVRLEDAAFRCNSDTESLHIPAGLTEMTDNFDDMNLAVLEIPENVTSIERSFVSLRNLTEVTIPGSVRTIGARSFTFCKNLRRITIPAGVTEIRSRFTGCSDRLVIRVGPGSYAEQYCREHQLNFEYISE